MNLRSSPCIAISIIRAPALLGLRHAEKIAERHFRAERPGVEPRMGDRPGYLPGTGNAKPDRASWGKGDAACHRRRGLPLPQSHCAHPSRILAGIRGHLIQIAKSAGSRSTKIGVGKEGPAKTSGFAMAQKNPRSHAALILIVDDDEAVVEITAEILETLGYDVLNARNGPEAIELLRKN